MRQTAQNVLEAFRDFIVGVLVTPGPRCHFFSLFFNAIFMHAFGMVSKKQPFTGKPKIYALVALFFSNDEF